MKHRVLEGCTLYREDGSVWAESGEIVDIAVDSPDPAVRTAAQFSLRGQFAKVRVTADGDPVARQDRSLTPSVTKGTSKKKATKKK
jgi:hypothetical protein